MFVVSVFSSSPVVRDGFDYKTCWFKYATFHELLLMVFCFIHSYWGQITQGMCNDSSLRKWLAFNTMSLGMHVLGVCACVCVCVCVCVFVYVCMYVCMYVYMYVCVYIYIYCVCACVYLQIGLKDLDMTIIYRVTLGKMQLPVVFCSKHYKIYWQKTDDNKYPEILVPYMRI